MKNFWHKFWRDSDNNVAVLQPPNPPIIGWIVTTIALQFIKTGSFHGELSFLSQAFLFTWAFLEITQGDSYFRRLFGLIIMIFLIVSHFK